MLFDFPTDELVVEEESETVVEFSLEVVGGVFSRLSRPDKAPTESVVKVCSTDSLFNVAGPFPIIINGFIVLEVSVVSSLFTPMKNLE